MRTTITLEDRLLERLKKRASETGTSVSRLLEQAARLLLEQRTEPKRGRRFKLVTFGRGGRFSDKNIDRTSALLEADDIERYASHC